MFAPWHVAAIDGTSLGAVIATIIAGGGLGGAMAHEFLHRDDVPSEKESFVLKV